jgi:hypothetical protein
MWEDEVESDRMVTTSLRLPKSLLPTAKQLERMKRQPSAWCLDQTKDLTLALIDPIPQVVHAVRVLGCKISLVGSRRRPW